MSDSENARNCVKHRRRFLSHAALGVGAGLLCRFPGLSLAADSRSTIDVLLDEPGESISPEIYGLFLEHFGTVIYDGVWVGENSSIPNIGGIRKAFVDALREIRSPVIRWPGGGFSDIYDWKDGIGPRRSRPRRTNPYVDFSEPGVTAGPQDYESNQFGTPEFMQLCKLTGSQPYLAANVRSLPAEDFRLWVEYCNSPRGSTSLADMRNSDGFSEPFNVKYWGIGNEQWTYLTAEEYAQEYRRFTQSVSRHGVDLRFIASGPLTDGFLPDAEWSNRTRQWISKLLEPGVFGFAPPYGISLHYYAFNLSGQPSASLNDYLLARRSDVHFHAAEWYELLRQSDKMGAMIEFYWTAMSERDPTHKAKLIVDEWATYYSPQTRLNSSNLQGHAVTLRDALSCALTLDTFNRHCDKVAMANLSFTINAGNSLFQAQGERFITTPIYHVFQMYSAHHGARQVRCAFGAPSISYELAGRPYHLWGLNGSASVRDREVTLTVVNPHVSEPHEAAITVRGGSIKEGSATTLTHRDIHAQNTFQVPQEVRPVTTELRLGKSGLSHVFPAASVSKIRILLK